MPVQVAQVGRMLVGCGLLVCFVAAGATLDEAKSLLQLKRFGDAEASLRRHLADEPLSEDGLYLLAYALFRQGRAAHSLHAYTRAAAVKPPAPDDWKVIGLNYGLLGDFERSAQYLERALAGQPSNLEARYYLGRVRFQQNRFHDAAAAFRAVLAAEPGHLKAQNELGQALEGLGEMDAAADAYRRAVALNAKLGQLSELPLLNLASLLLQQGDTAGALPLLEQAAALNSRSTKVQFRLGSTYQKLGRLAEAERALRAAALLDERDANTRYVLGRVYQQTGQLERARAEFAASQALRSGRRP